MKTKTSGFTLIELLVAIVIIGILATISTATFNGYIDKAKVAQVDALVNSMTFAVKLSGAESSPSTMYAAENITALQTLLNRTDLDYVLPNNPDICLIYGGHTDGGEFFVAAARTEDATSADVAAIKANFIVDGTVDGVANFPGSISAITAKCAAATGAAATAAGYTEFLVSPR